VICLPHSDTGLIIRCQERDPAAFDEIVARHKQKIFSYVYRMVGDSEEAEDITQDVFVKMYVSLSTFRSEASISTWLYRIAGNLCIDRYRKRSRRDTALGGSPLSLDSGADSGGTGAVLDVADTANEPGRLLQRAEVDAQVQAALTKLPPKMRAVVVLHDIEGLAYEEIAAAERCPLGTVKSRLFNARRMLKTLLAPYMDS
jgi:RNA polymerase sigma-70 factor (ECF subfamily)